jgi:uncharacterized protein GlcG (DUF336 family)
VQAATVLVETYTNATEISIPQNFAVVDPYGFLVAFLHMDNAYPGSMDISQRKPGHQSFSIVFLA